MWDFSLSSIMAKLVYSVRSLDVQFAGSGAALVLYCLGQTFELLLPSNGHKIQLKNQANYSIMKEFPVEKSAIHVCDGIWKPE